MAQAQSLARGSWERFSPWLKASGWAHPQSLGCSPVSTEPWVMHPRGWIRHPSDRLPVPDSCCWNSSKTLERPCLSYEYLLISKQDLNHPDGLVSPSLRSTLASNSIILSPVPSSLCCPSLASILILMGFSDPWAAPCPGLSPPRPAFHSDQASFSSLVLSVPHRVMTASWCSPCCFGEESSLPDCRARAGEWRVSVLLSSLGKCMECLVACFWPW